MRASKAGSIYGAAQGSCPRCTRQGPGGIGAVRLLRVRGEALPRARDKGYARCGKLSGRP